MANKDGYLIAMSPTSGAHTMYAIVHSPDPFTYIFKFTPNPNEATKFNQESSASRGVGMLRDQFYTIPFPEVTPEADS